MHRLTKITIQIFMAMMFMLAPVTARSSATCEGLFSPKTENKLPTAEPSNFQCDQACTDPAVLAHRLANHIEKETLMEADPSSAAGTRKSIRGFAIITAAMVASAAVTTHLTAELPKDMAFLSHLVGQVSTLGVFVLGAPIWEPISSAFRKFAFGLKDTSPTASDPALERQWHRAQGRYSLNAQMSRNVIQSFLLAAQSNFNTAREAMWSGRRELAIDQIAETAVRLRRLFGEIDPRDPSIALAVQSSFTRHVESPAAIEKDVMVRIEQNDSQAKSPLAQEYYRSLLDAWLKSPPSL